MKYQKNGRSRQSRLGRKTEQNDARITAGVTFRDCAVIFGVLVVVSGFHMLIFVTIQDQQRQSPQLVINALIGWLVFSAAVLTTIYWIIRRFLLERPMRRLSKAAKKIAEGDFSVRVEPLPKRKSKFGTRQEKNYIDVLIDDFNTMAEDLADIESMKNDFIADVSHEIKTPLSVIQNYAIALQDDAFPPEERKECIKTIIGASQRLSNLVTNILRLNKLEHTGIIPAAAAYDLGEQLRRCALTFEDLWERKDITFNVSLDDGVSVVCDESLLELVWNNLLSNAIKFTDAGGAITLTLAVRDGDAVVCVQDSGCGMDSKTVRRIFDKFYQGDSSHSGEGNGLGLAMVKKALELVGGEICVESKPGDGTCITVRVRVA
ncbi:MAG: HAMP domain-containing sensor histidine kinase [Treponemataceae bacterium]|nr:MAG: HAMP domain-containing sensor histidine kinase [Treponemataceae bacterium]